MKIFISSPITGFEPLRAAARAAVQTLRHEPIMAEDFAAQPNSPQIACLKRVRESDLVVLILGARYGAVQGPSGLSPTHEEYLEARGKKPILVFIQNGVTRDAKQAAFVADVQAWQGGLFRADFDDANDLQSEVIRAIHEYQVGHAAAPLDLKLLETTARELLSQSRRESSGSPYFKMAIVGGPIQQILRPAKLETAALKEMLHQHALFGEDRLFSPAAGVSYGLDNAALFLEQKGGSRIQIDEQGSLLFRQLVVDQSKSRERSGFMLAIIEETVLEQLNQVIGYATWVLDQIDATQRLTHVGIATTVDGSDYLGWRTQVEQDASPKAGRVYMNTGDSRPAICVNRPRAAMRFNRQELVEDVMVRLRRQYKD